ncbi:hypothetical protein RvY_11079 [Ramazzottius varieornatus]|uniref:Uncharacterized protein n=1 Tax=Ramazzottius varieornatus TaxID=947166 RepID=A0A1D1VEY0_RAMVA|nr:hypothetical protein RvY_11079 [Ramazzottius varieornatus]
MGPPMPTFRRCQGDDPQQAKDDDASVAALLRHRPLMECHFCPEIASGAVCLHDRRKTTLLPRSRTVEGRKSQKFASRRKNGKNGEKNDLFVVKITRKFGIFWASAPRLATMLILLNQRTLFT